MDKGAIRHLYANKRRMIAPYDKALMDAIIYNKALSLAERFHVFAIYHSFRSEVDTHQIIEALLLRGKVVACPIIKDGNMHFIRIKSLQDLEVGHFGIMEPKEGSYMDPLDFDCIFVPMLAYNDDFYRVGYGKGYYDRFLIQTTGLKVGLAYSMQHIDVAFEDDNDIAFDLLINEVR